jgi:thioredoxin reductase
MQAEKVVIIGGGPAGIACAVQLKRYGIDVLLIEKNEIGGLVKNAWRLDNYPGYPDGINGVVLVEKLKSHLKRFDIRYSISDIRYSKFSENSFYLESDTEAFQCDFLVVATGTKPKYSGDGLTEVYPLRDVRDKKIAIVGAGDAAFDYALTLSPHNNIHVHNRGKKIKCIPALLETALKQDNISYFENSSPSGSYDYTIFATGREPDLGCMSEELKKNQPRLEQQGRLYVIGDVKNGMVRQTSVATGDGIRAAMAIVERIHADESNQQDTGT